MTNDLINIRILQHDTEDQIRIGVAYPVTDLDKAEKDMAWCGGFRAACGKYYRRVALVDSQTLEVLRLIHPAD